MVVWGWWGVVYVCECMLVHVNVSVVVCVRLFV